MAERILDINPKCVVGAYECFYAADNADDFPLTKYHYVVDAIDTVSSKLLLIERAFEYGVPIISCMGGGNKRTPQDSKWQIFMTPPCVRWPELCAGNCGRGGFHR
jgi:tRNA A37 threonylcarbamoyladenosine dehydratase